MHEGSLQRGFAITSIFLNINQHQNLEDALGGQDRGDKGDRGSRETVETVETGKTGDTELTRLMISMRSVQIWVRSVAAESFSTVISDQF